MTRLVGNAREARGTIELVVRLDLTATAPEQRTAELERLADHLDAGSTVEVIVADLGEHAATAAQHLHALIDGGVHVKLAGPPEELHAWLSAMRDAS